MLLSSEGDVTLAEEGFGRSGFGQGRRWKDHHDGVDG